MHFSLGKNFCGFARKEESKKVKEHFCRKSWTIPRLEKSLYLSCGVSLQKGRRDAPRERRNWKSVPYIISQTCTIVSKKSFVVLEAVRKCYSKTIGYTLKRQQK